jgi:hypothetical protein
MDQDLDTLVRRLTAAGAEVSFECSRTPLMRDDARVATIASNVRAEIVIDGYALRGKGDSPAAALLNAVTVFGLAADRLRRLVSNEGL